MATVRMQTGMNTAAIHRAYLDAGADIIRTDTLTGPGPEARGPSDEEAYEAALVARLAADESSRMTPERPRLVAGVIGAGVTGISGLIDGGVDLLLAETLTHTAQIDAVLAATARRASPPLMVSVAVTPAGRLPSGQSIDDVIRAVRGAPLYSLGVNCGSGVDGLHGVLAQLTEGTACRTSCHPAAGLPDAFGQYDEPPAVTAAFLRDMAADGLVDIIGGCCGTTPEHIAAIARAAQGLADRMLGFRE